MWEIKWCVFQEAKTAEKQRERQKRKIDWISEINCDTKLKWNKYLAAELTPGAHKSHKSTNCPTETPYEERIMRKVRGIVEHCKISEFQLFWMASSTDRQFNVCYVYLKIEQTQSFLVVFMINFSPNKNWVNSFRRIVHCHVFQPLKELYAAQII